MRRLSLAGRPMGWVLWPNPCPPHWHTAYFNFPHEKGKTTLLFLLSPFTYWGSPCIWMPACFSSPQKAPGPWPGFQFPSWEHLTEGDRAVLLLSLKMANLRSLIWCCSQVWVLTALYLRAGSSPPSCATWTAPFTPLTFVGESPRYLTLQDFRSAEVRLSSSLSLSTC